MKKKTYSGRIPIFALWMCFGILSGCRTQPDVSEPVQESEVSEVLPSVPQKKEDVEAGGKISGEDAQEPCVQDGELSGSQGVETDGSQEREADGLKDREPDGSQGKEADSLQDDEPDDSQTETDNLQNQESVLQDVETITAPDRNTVKEELMESMQQLRQPGIIDISLLALDNPELDMKNIYYGILAEYPELKYTYDIHVALEGNEVKRQLFYMPYKTGIFPEEFEGEEAGSIAKLLAIADEHLGEISVPVRITNTQLEPDAINRALWQVGGGYILCTLNTDATALQYSAPSGMEMEDCIAALDLAAQMADEIIAEIVTADMTQREQAEALYSYLAQNVSYDQRYYSDWGSMPYESQTAVGALRDHLAICSGYANALKLLYEKIGISCYNITGRYFNEYHMWNLAKLKEEWLWFDVTTDRGNSSEYGFLRFALAKLDSSKYQYEEQDVLRLLD